MSINWTSRRAASMVFRSFRGRFGNHFLDKYKSGEIIPPGQPYEGKDAGLVEALEIWADELEGLTMGQIEHGLKHRFKYPPSADEFILACHESRAAHAPAFKALPSGRYTAQEKAVAKEFMNKFKNLLNNKLVK